MKKKSARTADQRSGAGLASVRPWVRFQKQSPPEKTTTTTNKKKQNTENKKEHSLPSKTSIVILPLDMKTC